MKFSFDDPTTKQLLLDASFILKRCIDDYYIRRGLAWPTTKESLLWLITEVGEACEADLMTSTHWIRNNPQKQLSSLSEELGDVVLMAMVTAGTGENPLVQLVWKCEAKLKEMEV